MSIRTTSSPLKKYLLDQVRDLKTVIVLLGVVWTGLNVHFARAGVLDSLVQHQATMQAAIDKNAVDIQKTNLRMTKEMVSRQDYEHDTQQLNIQLNNISSSVQQVINLIVTQRPAPYPSPVYAPIRPRPPSY